MSTYTITEKTLRAIVRKRSELAAEYGAALAKPDGLRNACELYGYAGKTYRHPRGIRQALTNRQWANVRLVNRTTIDCALPVKRMAEWAKGATRLAMEVIPDYRPAQYGAAMTLAVKLTRGESSAVFYGKHDEAPILQGNRNAAPVAWLGEHIQINAPADGGEFVA